MTPAVLTFAELARLEPRLLALAGAVQDTRQLYARRRNLCGNAIWYGHGRFPDHRFKDRMSALVGWQRSTAHPDPAADALLRTPRAYDVAYHHLYRLLPDCRRCACL